MEEQLSDNRVLARVFSLRKTATEIAQMLRSRQFTVCTLTDDLCLPQGCTLDSDGC